MLPIIVILVFVATFVVAGIAVLVSWFALLKRREADVQVSELQSHTEGEEEAPGLLRDESMSSISVWRHLLEKFDFPSLLATYIEQAGLSWSVGRVTLAMLLIGAVTWALVSTWFPGWAAFLAGCLTGGMPYFYIGYRRNRRFAKFEEHFPDALDSLSRALRAGYPFPAAIDQVANEAEAPVGAELKKTAVEGNFGTSWAHALDNLAVRMPILEVSMFVAAVQLQSRTGGKLGEVLGRLSENMRESVALKSEVRAIAAHGKMTGAVLTILPLGIAVMMMIVSPSYLQILVTNPMGKYLILGGAVCLIAGHFVIRKIVNITI